MQLLHALQAEAVHRRIGASCRDPCQSVFGDDWKGQDATGCTMRCVSTWHSRRSCSQVSCRVMAKEEPNPNILPWLHEEVWLQVFGVRAAVQDMMRFWCFCILNCGRGVVCVFAANFPGRVNPYSWSCFCCTQNETFANLKNGAVSNSVCEALRDSEVWMGLRCCVFVLAQWLASSCSCWKVMRICFCMLWIPQTWVFLWFFCLQRISASANTLRQDPSRSLAELRAKGKAVLAAISPKDLSLAFNLPVHLMYSTIYVRTFFPTCQVRVVRFYVSSCPPPSYSSASEPQLRVPGRVPNRKLFEPNYPGKRPQTVC